MSSMSLKSGYTYRPTPENYTAVHSALGVLDLQWQPDLIDLDVDERKGLRKMWPDALDFSKKALSYGRSIPRSVPGTVDVDEFGQDIAAYEQLQEDMRHLAKTYKMLTNSIEALGSKIRGNGSACYAGLQTAAKLGEPGAQLAVDDLAVLYERQNKSAKSAPPPAAPDPGPSR